MDIEHMSNLLHECREADSTILFIIGRPKDANVVCYSLDESSLGIEVYWRLINGRKYPISFIEKSLAIGVQAVPGSSDKKFYVVSFPQLNFTVKKKVAFRNEKQISFVFLSEPKSYFSIRPKQIFIRYTNGETETIHTN